MTDAIAAHAAFKGLLDKCLGFGHDYIKDVAVGIGRSQQTVRQYGAAIGTKSHRSPPADIIEKLREGLIWRTSQVYKTLPLDSAKGYLVQGAPQVVRFFEYLTALDYADSHRAHVATHPKPKLDDDARLRHEWRQVAFGGVVPVDVLAAIAGLDRYTVGWVGRESRHGIQPTFAEVSAAMSAEALTERGRIAA